MKPSHSLDLIEQIKAVVDILLQTITASSKRKYVKAEFSIQRECRVIDFFRSFSFELQKLNTDQ